ncbi:MAG: hypothetical protein CM1200mP29_00040 [Verrucomicrobiota bacterium]|nr:MAG: hypothetical protein CM1200mP29_00040 [Verrucomicrobiota bacterium]
MPDYNSKPKVRAITGGGTYLAGTESLVIELDVVGTPMTIQWTRGNQPIEGATQRWLQLVNLSPSHAGRYAVTLRNPFGIENSNPVEVNFPLLAYPIVGGGEGAIEASPKPAFLSAGYRGQAQARPGEGLGFDRGEGDVTGSEEWVMLVMDDHKTALDKVPQRQQAADRGPSPRQRAAVFFSAPSDVEIIPRRYRVFTGRSPTSCSRGRRRGNRVGGPG